MKARVTKVDAQAAQYYMRQAFEEGFRAASDGPKGRSEVDPKKGAWFDHWLKSQARETLVASGLITGMEGYK